MATSNKDLSYYDKDSIPDGSNYSFGIIVSEWNPNITNGLLDGAIKTLKECGVKEQNIHVKYVPGTFELPLAAQLMFDNLDLDGQIAIGSVIQGETRHFDFVCDAVTQGITQVNLKYNKPLVFCVLTDNNMQQAIDRSGGKHGNKGIECAIAAIKMVDFKAQLIN